MKRLLKQKLSTSLSYAFYTLLVSVVILAIIGGFSYFKIWKFDFGKLPLFTYVVAMFLFNTFYFLLVASKDYFQDFGMDIESSYHRKQIKKATIFERIFNIVLVFGIIIGIIYLTRIMSGYLHARQIEIYYDKIGVFTKGSLLSYMPKVFVITTICSLAFNSLIFLAYKLGAVKIFILFTAIIIAVNVFFSEYLISAFKLFSGLNMFVYLGAGVVAIILSVLFTNFIKGLNVK
ncbi:MAG: hypothetical protein E6162_01195 [Finegoldia magna]|uniref:hypothetical protein n=1 Tax=Finegoldia magna TaxID=1260 RepID=UPI00290E9CCF|nr:hypothetical protein [Finegoldia magna]MDU5271797.1 hypothetical protein [Finegoldia magna]MDU5441247.1 hypothetical protein [Finegoldia magna]MDU7032515.1 hypothetical protein [Finegoldia magna]